MSENGWDEVADVIVVGSGSAGLSAAITAAKAGADVICLEKAEQLGGTTAWSGGAVWAPLNDCVTEAGLQDSREEVLRYLESLGAERFPDRALIERFVDTAAEALRFLDANSGYTPGISPLPDYFGDMPGATRAGRCLEPRKTDAKEMLGDWWDKVRDSPHLAPMSDEEWSEVNMPVHARPIEDGSAPKPAIGELVEDRLANGIRFMGPALATGLVRGALDAGVSLRTGTAADRLIVEQGRAIGLLVKQGEDELRIGARRAVILASGGFEWNEELTQAYLGLPDCQPMSPSTNTGDGLQMGLEAGAAVANMTSWLTMPAFDDHETTEAGRPLVQVTGTRQDSGAIFVNGRGRRFVNEGATYMDVGKAVRHYDYVTASYPNTAPIWMIFDQTARDRCVDLDPETTPDWVPQADTIEALADRLDIEPEALADEVSRWNSFVDDGNDPDQHRGEVWWESYPMGGTSPESSMSRIETAPFYAIQVFNGVACTFGGLRIDTEARVKAARGGVIDGLFAAGAVANYIFGQTYPGPGATLGPNLVFGYIAGQGAAAERSLQID